MEAVPPTRDGFTRDTCSDTCPESKNDDERVVICPACNEELAYDPTDTSPPGSTAGGRKRKRAAGQHHFWALKKCGHVYCADCFENRRPTKAAPAGVGFQSPTGKPPVTVPTDLRCAVEGCETKVATKTEWIGIFL
ncbi:cell cycle control protein [Ophiocordyceps sinensis CO18]|nr:cell cycle control protein [Ophiocordyceps sinensis CO18]